MNFVKKVFVTNKAVVAPQPTPEPAKAPMSLAEKKALLEAELKTVTGKGDAADDHEAPPPSREAQAQWQKDVAALFPKMKVRFTGVKQVYVDEDGTNFHMFVQFNMNYFSIVTSFDTASFDLHGVRKEKLMDAIKYILAGKKVF